ncbi:11562_t:CDS:2, partial [Dentiscutata erythropus]
DAERSDGEQRDFFNLSFFRHHIESLAELMLSKFDFFQNFSEEKVLSPQNKR